MVDVARERGVEGSTVLEVGGGVGEVQVELLRAGARRAVSVELTPTHEEAATELLDNLQLRERVERTVADFVGAGDSVAAADVVVLNRVICCYPDMPALAGAAARHTRTLLVMSYPASRWWIRVGLAAGNALLWLARREFHIFVHRPDRIGAAVEGGGLRSASRRKGLFWEVAAWERPGGVAG